MFASGHETGAAGMEMSPAGASAAQGRRAGTVVERKLDELCACLDNALSSSPRSLSPGAEARLVEDIKKRTDFLRSLLVAEGECHGAAARPPYLVDAEARFAVLEAAFDQWARRVGAEPAAAAEEEEEEEMERLLAEEDSGSGSESECSCADSCQEAAEAATGDADVDADRVAVGLLVDVTPDATDEKRDSVVAREDAVADQKRDAVATREEAAAPDADAKKRDAAERHAAVETKRRTVQRRWWRRSAAWCGAAGVVAVVAVGVAVELAAVAHNNVSVYVVPT